LDGEKMKSTSSNKRILAKCFTYRMVSIAVTILLVWSVTGEISGALKIGALDFFIKMGLQFGNEKLWKMSTWGKFYHD
jgi:uncharacterized membrane protein